MQGGASITAMVQEVGERSRVLDELMVALQAEEVTKCQLLHEVKVLTARSAELQGTLQEAIRDKSRAEDAYTSASAALSTLRRRAQLLREEKQALMATYDSRLEGLVRRRGSAWDEVHVPVQASPTRSMTRSLAVYGTPPRGRAMKQLGPNKNNY